MHMKANRKAQIVSLVQMNGNPASASRDVIYKQNPPGTWRLYKSH